MNLNAILKKSIQFESSKTDLTNLVNHKADDLCIVIEAIEFLMRDYEEEIDLKQEILERAEDMSTAVEANLNQAIAWRTNQIQSLIAWRAIFFTALEQR